MSINDDPGPAERRALLTPGDPETGGLPPAGTATAPLDYGTINKLPRAFNFQDVRMSIAAGMMDLSLFIANTNQLANVIRTPENVKLTDLETFTVVLICFSIFLQVFVVLLLIWRPGERADNNRGTVTCVFLILVVNVFVACLNNEQQHYGYDPAAKLVPCSTNITTASVNARP